ncbi:MAG: hypothetical protein HYX80_09555 [Chloroflexi bacterium]|nr:hypothetical protein [Chloroflexota bacterium]
MTNNTSSRSFEQGPYLSAALLCEKVLIEKDEVKSAIRIIDRVNRSVVGPNPPIEMEPFEYELTLLLKFKSGRARGVHSVRIQPVKPSGELMPATTNNVLFEGEEDRGVDIVGNMRFKFEETGIYWIHIYLNETRMTQIPLRVTYVPQVRAGSRG